MPSPCLAVFAGLLAALHWPAHAAVPCPVLPEFKRATGAAARLPAARAASTLEAYAATHENPEACEAFELDRRLGLIEARLFVLRHGEKRVAAQLVARCNEFDPTTARCSSPMEDGTARPAALGVKPLSEVLSGPLEFENSRNGTSSLLGVYVIRLSDAVDGRAATPVQPVGGELRLPRGLQNFALMAVFKTEGAWRFRKAVWYF